jgi:segregation and condensation protein B
MADAKDARIALLEAILFTTHEPLKIEQIAKIMKIRNAESVKELLEEVKKKYSSSEHGVTLSETGGYRLSVKHEFVEKVSNLTPHSDMSRGVLRVLSLVAFHEPVAQSEIVKIVGNRTYEYVKELKEHGLVKGERKGRTSMLSVTPHFEEYFNVNKEELKKEMAKKKEVQTQ